MLRSRPALFVVVAFVGSRFLYYLAGLRFDAVNVPAGLMQLLDLHLLHTDLARSIFYLQAQPPLFNLFVGCGLKLGSAASPIFFHLCYLSSGLLLSVCLFGILAETGISPWPAAVVSALFSASPSVVLYENVLFYMQPLTATLCFAAFCLMKYLKTARLFWLLFFFGLLGGLSLTHSLFHLAWLVLTTIVLALVLPAERKRIFAVSCLPVLLCAGWYAKNAVVFGVFGPSSWFGSSMARMTVYRLPSEVRVELAAQGAISPYAIPPPFPSVEEYRTYLPATKPWGVPAIDQERKENGDVNYNHYAYIIASRALARDSRWVLRYEPLLYVRTVLAAWYFYFTPAGHEVSILPASEGWLGTASRVWNIAVCGQLRPLTRADIWRMRDGAPMQVGALAGNEGLLLVVVLPVLTLWAFRLTKLKLRLDRRQGVLLVFLLFTILFVSVGGNCSEVGENNRYRSLVDPFFVVLLAHCASMLWARFTSRTIVSVASASCGYNLLFLGLRRASESR